MSRYELWQDGKMMAAVECEDADQASQEIMHYAMVYGQDGPVVVYRVDDIGKHPIFRSDV